MKAAFFFVLLAIALAQCPDGQYVKNGECSPCEVGYYCKNDERKACTFNYYADEEGLSECKVCANDGDIIKGAFATNGYGNTHCDVCAAGYMCRDGKSTPCDAFSYSTEGSSQCVVCPLGNYLITSTPYGRMVNSDCAVCGEGYACPDIFTRYECGGQSYSPAVAGDCLPCFGEVADNHASCNRVVCAEGETYINGKCIAQTSVCEPLEEGWTYDHAERIYGTTAFHACSEVEGDNIAGYTTKVCTAEGWMDGFNYCAAPISGSMGVDVHYVFHNVYYTDVIANKEQIFNAFLYAMPAWLGDLIITKIEDQSSYEDNTMATVLEVRLYALVHKHSEVIKNIQFLGHASNILDKFSFYMPAIFHPGMSVEVQLMQQPVDFRAQCPAEVENWIDTFQWSQQHFEDDGTKNVCPTGTTGTIVRNCISKALSARWGPAESHACWSDEYLEHSDYGMIYGTIKLTKLYYNYVGTNSTRFIIPAMIRAQPIQIYDLETSALWSEQILSEDAAPHAFIPVTAFNFRYVIPRANVEAVYNVLSEPSSNPDAFINKFYDELQAVDFKRFFSQVIPSIEVTRTVPPMN